MAKAQTFLLADLRKDVFPAPVNTQQDSQRYATIRLGARVA